MRDDLPLEMGVFYRGLPILPNAGKSINHDAWHLLWAGEQKIGLLDTAMI